MPATLDPRKAYVTRQHGDLVVVFTWFNDERAMVLLPVYRPGAPWYIVCDSTAWRYDDPAYLARQFVTACDVLGIELNRPNWVRVSGSIDDGLPDLVKVPTASPAEFDRGSFGDMTLRANGHVLARQDIPIKREEATYADGAAGVLPPPARRRRWTRCCGLVAPGSTPFRAERDTGIWAMSVRTDRRVEAALP